MSQLPSTVPYHVLEITLHFGCAVILMIIYKMNRTHLVEVPMVFPPLPEPLPEPQRKPQFNPDWSNPYAI